MKEQRARDLKIARMYQGGMTPKEIEAKAGFSRGIVEGARKRVGISANTNRLKKAELEARNIRILAEHDGGAETADIARNFGMAYITAHGIITRMVADRSVPDEPEIEMPVTHVRRDPCFHCNVRGELHDSLGCKNYAVAA
jgi:hypothetical protein